MVVRGAGLEPARYFYHEPLKLACLPFHHPRIETCTSFGIGFSSIPIGADRGIPGAIYFGAGAPGDTG